MESKKQTQNGECLAPTKKFEKPKRKETNEPTRWQRRLGWDVRYSARMIKVMKSFMNTFIVRQRVESLQFPN